MKMKWIGCSNWLRKRFEKLTNQIYITIRSNWITKFQVKFTTTIFFLFSSRWKKYIMLVTIETRRRNIVLITIETCWRNQLIQQKYERELWPYSYIKQKIYSRNVLKNILKIKKGRRKINIFTYYLQYCML